jgi:hypothetical protein
MDKTPHEVLGVPAGCSRETARAAYRRMIRVAHPDRAPCASVADAQRINRAWTDIQKALCATPPLSAPAPAPVRKTGVRRMDPEVRRRREQEDRARRARQASATPKARDGRFAHNQLSLPTRHRMSVTADGRIGSVIRAMVAACYTGVSMDAVPPLSKLREFGLRNMLPGMRDAQCKSNREDSLDIIASAIFNHPNRAWE